MPTPDSWSPAIASALSGSPLTDALLGPTRWASGNLSYSFAAPGSPWSTDPETGYGARGTVAEPWASEFSGLGAGNRTSFATAIQAWMNVANLQLTPVTESATLVGDIRVAFSFLTSTDDAQAWAYLPDNGAIAGDIWINARSTSFTAPWTPGSFEYQTVLHELGHAFGLKHSFEPETGNDTILPLAMESRSYTVMSYAAANGDQDTNFSVEPTTPMRLDIAAIQHLYGANTGYQAGDDTYSFTDFTTYHETLWDAGGEDSINYSGALPSLIDLRAGEGSRIGQAVYVESASAGRLGEVDNVWIADGAIIENARGGRAGDTLIGNAVDNTLTGGGGNDSIDGGAGIDSVMFSGNRLDYSALVTASGATVSDSVGSRDGSDTLVDVERLLFADAKVALDIDGSAGQAYRLYQAAFDRIPDIGGLSNWIHALDAGTSLTSAAQSFAASAEFQNKYGSAVSNTGFVTLLYSNVLHRDADAGFVNWVNELAAGLQSQAQVLAAFSESAENKANVRAQVAAGITYDGSAGERLTGTSASETLNGGVGLDTVVEHGNRAQYSIAISADGATLSDSVAGRDGSDTLRHVERIAFADSTLALDVDATAGDVYRLYQAAFNRTPDVGGLSNWVRAADAGMTLDAIAKAFSESAEFTQRFGAGQTDTEFLTTLYDNVLHRAPDDAGLTNWLTQLDAHALSRAQVLTGFSDSAENFNNVTALIQNGIALDLG